MGFGQEDDKQLAQELTLRAVELGMSAALGGDVRLELAPRTTVLVGKNGAGKSAILERIESGFQHLWGVPRSSQPDPGRFECELQFEDGRKLVYDSIWRESETPPTDNLIVVARLEETFRLEEEVGHDERLLVRGSTDTSNNLMMMGGGRAEAYKMRSLLTHWSYSVGRIGATGARGTSAREALVLHAKSTHPLANIASRLRHWQQMLHAEFEELLAVGRRTRLFHDITIKRHADPSGDFTSVMVDDVNLRLLSDGTLRALEIFTALIHPAIKLLLIDEPEGAAHPGLLARMLAEIEAYSMDKQIVLATQSPQVVSWAQPEAIRLVERNAGVTTVRGLDELTVNRLERYLHDGDTLGDFIYGGGVDGFAE